MAIYNLGSINIDYFYQVEHLPAPGETISAIEYMVNLGGKGLNTSVAAQRAGADVRHVGAVGRDDAVVRRMLAELGVDDTRVVGVEAQTGHAVVYVDAASENSIVIFGGANQAIDETNVRAGLDGAGPGDWLLLQNETNANELGLKIAREKGMKVALVAAPFETGALVDLIGQVDLVSMNRTETAQYEAALGQAVREVQGPAFLLTYGAEGSVFIDGESETRVAAFAVDAVDTTAAGDTFFGTFLAQHAAGAGIKEAMRFASAAAAVKVTRKGAAKAIPKAEEVRVFLRSVSE
ncbi:ribokinase [Shimia abyssi]|uniref:Ribokinase n=1 Tax=Shimia abyssi TaxID=1662395 RepID=A0A2P8F983_9RHOB|nr:ribokinase [Shimia abyssi]PSL18258.1 ribokinase [Shimia abyssi]